MLKGSSAAMGPLVEVFSFMAIVTSFIGYILGLSEFLQDVLPSEGRAARASAYAITLIPPYFLALAFPEVFFAALDKVRGRAVPAACLSIPESFQQACIIVLACRKQFVSLCAASMPSRTSSGTARLVATWQLARLCTTTLALALPTRRRNAAALAGGHVRRAGSFWRPASGDGVE